MSHLHFRLTHIIAFICILFGIALYMVTNEPVSYAELTFAEESITNGIEGSILPASCESDPNVTNGHAEYSGCSQITCWDGSFAIPAAGQSCPARPTTTCWDGSVITPSLGQSCPSQLPAEPTFSAICTHRSDGNFNVTLNWNSVSGAVNYPVRVTAPNASRYGGPIVVGNGAVGDAAPTGNSYTFSPNPAFSMPGTYTYGGYAWNSYGWSTYTSRTVTCEYAAPTNLTVTPDTQWCGSGTLNLRWNSVANVGYYTVEVYRSGQLYQSFNSSWTSATAYGTPGMTYDVRVRGQTNSGPTAWSNFVSGTPPTCPACTGSIPPNAARFDSEEVDSLSANTPWTYAASDTAAKCQYTCSTGFSWNGSACIATPLYPDLTPSLPTPSLSSVAQGGSINFNTNTITNAGAAIAGAHDVGGFYVDNNGDGTADYTVQLPRQTNTTAVSGTYTQTLPWSVPSNAPTGSNYRIGYIVDVSNEVSESNEGNNFSGWSAPFSVTASGPTSCAGATINNCVLPSGGSGSQIAGTCSTGYSSTCRYTCNSGSWNWTLNTNTCAAPLITEFEVCLANGTSCGSSITVAPSTPLMIRWNATNADNCARQTGPVDFSTGGAISGTDLVTASAAANDISTYTIICSQDGSGATSRTANVTVSTVAGPDLTVNKITVSPGDTITLSWDTNNGSEGSCTLTGGGLTSATLTNGTGDAETGFTDNIVTGRTTFRLTCGAQSDVKTVEVIPVGWES